MQALRKIDPSQLWTPRNRGLLLDVIVFVINLLLMTVLTRLFTQFVRQADEDRMTQAAALLYCLGLAFLQPIGALLKRRRAHERQPELDLPTPNFLFHPIFYFLSKLLFLIAAGAKIVDL